MSDVCNKCNAVIEDKKVSAKCLECSSSYHLNCCGLKSAEVWRKRGGKSTWRCDSCMLESASSVSKSDNEGTDNVMGVLQKLRQDISDNMKETRGRFDGIDKNIESLRSSIDESKVKIAALETENQTLRMMCESNKADTDKVKKEAARLRSELLDLQQYTRRNNLEIKGIPPTHGEDPYIILEGIAKALDVPWFRGDISVAHRLQHPRYGGQPSIIAAFVSRSVKEDWLAAAREKKLTTKQISHKLAPGPVFIFNHLTVHNKQLLYRARMLVRERKLANAWTVDGKVLVRKMEGGRGTRVCDLEDLEKLMMEKNLTGLLGEEERCLGRRALTEVTCPATWDTILCWPPTDPGTLALLPCFSELNGIKYDTSKNASRWCHQTGVWDNYTDYTACLSQMESPANSYSGVEIATTIYALGYIASLVALGVAVWIFLFFKDLQCLRNNIHTNLMCTYILADSMWILNMILQGSINNSLVACAIFFLLHYFYLTSFFWMFVEGLYLYLLVVETFIRETVRLRFYAVIGWGTPMVIVSAWGLAKSFAISDPEDYQCFVVVATCYEGNSRKHTHNTRAGVPAFPLMSIPLQKMPNQSSAGGCSWMTPHPYDWIYQAPVFTVLALNLLFLIRIMWVLITKLRSANNAETQQYRKASKALVVLIPLLGITYILVIVGPSQGVTAHIYTVLRAVLLSTQGLAVALFYCFFNSEVRNTLRTRLDRWNDARELGAGRRFSRFNYTKDWSPHTRTESIRLCQTVNSAPGSFRKRESTASETTLMTVVGTGSGRVSNGSVGATSLIVRSSICPQLLDGADSV